jgi:hypothetical protein
VPDYLRSPVISPHRGGRPSPPSDLPLFRFGLRQLLAFVAAASGVLAGVVVAEGVLGLVIVLAVLIVAAHVTATALGSRLREVSKESDGEYGKTNAEHSVVSIGGRHSSILPRSCWHGHDGTPLVWLPTISVVGVIVGGCCGGLFLASTIGDRTSLAGLFVGAISMAILGGWFAFLASSFYAIFRHGWREAVANEERRMTFDD